MASVSPLKDIDEQFLQCCICMEQLKDPKILPCLHRYCLECLKTTVKTKGNKIECPTCREKHTLPEGGFEGLKTDFNTKNIIEFIQLQESVKHEPLKECGGCSKKLRVSAYCFRCNEFLCEGCHNYHKTAKILKDHCENLFSLSEAEARNLTIEKLSSLKEAPRCHTHPQRLSELCCMACGNAPICMPCTYGAHQGHVLKEVSLLAKIERERLHEKLAELMQYKDKIYKKQEDIKKIKEKLNKTVNERKQRLQDQLDTEEDTVKRATRDAVAKLKQGQTELEEKWRKRASIRKQQLEKELKEAREKYDKICEEDRREADEELTRLQQENDREKVKLQERLDTMNKNITELLASLTTQEEEKTKQIKELYEHFDDIMKRFETVTTTANTIIAARHDWTDVQCIPDICTAIDPLIEEVKKEMPGLETLSDIKRVSLVIGRKERVDISEEVESVVDIGSIMDLDIHGITSSKDGNIIITGCTSGRQAHITLINTNGKQLRQMVFKSDTSFPRHCCDILYQSKVAFVHWSKDIGIYDTTDGTHRKIDISKVVTWPSGQTVQCVAVDHVTDEIIVGCTGQDVYVFDSELHYITSLRLPERPQWLADITVHNDILLLCDLHGKRAYAVTMNEPQCKQLYELPHPDHGGNHRPCSVCTDKNGFIYILWIARFSGRNRSMVVQYSQDSSQILATRLLDAKYYAICISTVDTGQGEKLVMATNKTRKLITYALK